MRVRFLGIAPGLVIGLGVLAAACGSGAAPAAPVAKDSPAAHSIGITHAVVNGRAETILTDGTGRSLYLFTPEKDGKVVTTSDVLQTWSPLRVADDVATPTSGGDLPGKLGTLTRPDGVRQATYNEWPLYTYVGDKKRGDVAGEGIDNRWFVVQAVMPVDADNDSDGTTAAPAPTATAPAPAQAPAPQPTQAPSFNDQDGDNRGGPSDGDGNG